ARIPSSARRHRAVRPAGKQGHGGRHGDADAGDRGMAARSLMDCGRSRLDGAGAAAEGADMGAEAHVPVGRSLRADSLESAVSDGGTGTLYVISTPIGNMGDFSFRAVETLRAVDLVLAEDTRHSGQLLKRYEIPA